MKRPQTILPVLVLAAAFAVEAADKPEHNTYSKNEVLQKIEAFFGEGAEGIANVVEQAFDEQGRPNAYIVGDEVAAALGLGVRYGKGDLETYGGGKRTIYWQGPSIGFDAGADAAKVFVLIYDLPDPSAIFQRFPGVEGSLYFVGGIGMHYLQSGEIRLAPIRFGAGWRQGVNMGYMDFTREASVIPF
jgi:hypothetical protein